MFPRAALPIPILGYRTLRNRRSLSHPLLIPPGNFGIYALQTVSNIKRVPVGKRVERTVRQRTWRLS